MSVLVIAILFAVILWLLLRQHGSSQEHEIGLTFTVERGYDYDDDDRHRDSWEGPFWEAGNPLDLETELHLKYRDAQGAVTERGVRTRSFDNDLYGGMMIGHCQLRNATRTFRFDRVQQAVDLATGEVIGDLGAHLNRLHEESPERVRETLESDYRNVLRVLFYVAKADGQYRQEEKVVVRRYLRELVDDPRLTDAMVDRIFTGMNVPTLPAFKQALGRAVSQQVVDPARLHEVCREIVATQDAVSPGEQEALDYLARKLPESPSAAVG